MTLIVGIKCNDGVVVGADGAATLGNLSQNTARQPVRKLISVSNSMIVGIAGSVGLSQFLSDSIHTLWDAGGLKGKQPVQGMGILRDTLRPHAFREIQAAGSVRSAIGDNALKSALCATVVAVTLARTDCLFQFDHQAAPEAATSDLPFIAIGSGQTIADPFLSFLRKIFWPGRLPSLSEGVLATLWSLRHAIETNPGGVADPIQIMTLSSGKVHELDAAELIEHSQAIEAAERALSGFRDAMASGSSEPPPVPT